MTREEDIEDAIIDAQTIIFNLKPLTDDEFEDIIDAMKGERK